MGKDLIVYTAMEAPPISVSVLYVRGLVTKKTESIHQLSFLITELSFFITELSFLIIKKETPL